MEIKVVRPVWGGVEPKEGLRAQWDLRLRSGVAFWL